MRRVHIDALGRAVSVLGFGCASIGSRTSKRSSLLAIELALDQGVNWFDVAPSYGDGRAEGILGEALRGRHDKVVVCSKVGIARPTISRVKQMLRPAARTMLKIAPELRGAVRHSRPTGERGLFSEHEIERSVERTLKLLRMDHLDILALHEPTPTQAADPEIFERIERLRARQLVGNVSIAGSLESIVAAARAGMPFEFAQLRYPHGGDACQLIASEMSTPPSFVTHSVFNRSGPRADRGAFDAAMSKAALLQAAFARNPRGVVIVSMTTPAHIQVNCAAASLAPSANARA